MALWVRQAEVEFICGEPKEWVRVMPSGRIMACQFCPTCGTRLFHKTLGQSEFMSIKPGTLNDTKALDPVGHIWTASKQSWIRIPDSSLQYTGNPPDFEELLSAWNDEHN